MIRIQKYRLRVHYLQHHYTQVRHGYAYPYPITARVFYGTTAVGTETVLSTIAQNGTGSNTVSGEFDCTEAGTITVYYYCNDKASDDSDFTHTCNSGATTSEGWSYQRVAVGSFSALEKLPYVSDVGAEKVASGKVYNENGVINGDDKLDWNFYCTWDNAEAGTQTISKYRINLYKNDTLITYVDNAVKLTKYNFETLIPKCKVGEIYDFYINTYATRKFKSRLVRKHVYRKYIIV